MINTQILNTRSHAAKLCAMRAKAARAESEFLDAAERAARDLGLELTHHNDPDGRPFLRFTLVRGPRQRMNYQVLVRHAQFCLFPIRDQLLEVFGEYLSEC